jgi:hypothetical protein
VLTVRQHLTPVPGDMSVFLSLLLILQTPVPSDTTIVSAVRAAAEREPVEAYGNAPGLVRVRDIVLLDIDGDGSPEAFVWIVPKFQQSPTILAYTYDAQHGARRVLEALVPGQFQPVSGRFVDDHTLGLGIDMTVSSAGKPVDFDRLIAAGVLHHLSLVRFKTFLHTDGRAGFVMYVDLSDRALPSPGTQTCEQLEFSPVEGLIAGSLAGARTPYLVALTVNDITIYRFHGIRPNGTFDKESWTRPRPADVVGVEHSPGGDIVLKSHNGQTTPVAAP